jgi:lipopolysaccharide export system protein LptA
MKPTKVLYTLLFSLFSLVEVFGQTGQIEMLPGTESMQAGQKGGVKIIRLLGNVKLKQKETLLYCDSAHLYRESNYVEIFSNVRVVQGNMTITSSTATYNGAQRTANFRGNVVMRDDKMTLTTPSLFYNLATRNARYTEGGTIVESDTRLTSQAGNYNMGNKMLSFRGNVRVLSKDADITSDSLQYNTNSKVVFFVTQTRIQTSQAVQFAKRGTYNTVTKEAVFQETEIDTEDYIITARSSSYDQVGRYAYFTGNVKMTSKDPKNRVIITGQVAQYWREQGRAKVSGSPVMKSLVSGDTLMISADTLISINNKDPKKKDFLYAYYGVRIFKTDLQGRCDSLTYSLSDSVMFMNSNPILWANNSQLVSDRMEMFMKRKTIDQMKMFNNAFIISQDTLKNLNQVKGRDMVAFFDKGNIRRVDVNGNGESIYFALEGDSVLTGMNKSVSSDLVLKFKDKKMETITFLTNPDLAFIPPHELKEPDKRLRGFKWRPEEKPTKADVLAKRTVKSVRPAKPATAAPAKKTPPAKKVKETRAQRLSRRNNGN